jgi:hypothetical protein
MRAYARAPDQPDQIRPAWTGYQSSADAGSHALRPWRASGLGLELRLRTHIEGQGLKR